MEPNTEKLVKFMEELNSSEVPTRINRILNYLNVAEEEIPIEEIQSNKALIKEICPSFFDILVVLRDVNNSNRDNKETVSDEEIEKVVLEKYLEVHQ